MSHNKKPAETGKYNKENYSINTHVERWGIIIQEIKLPTYSWVFEITHDIWDMTQDKITRYKFS